MNCRDAELLLSADQDGALDQNQRIALETHVAACSSCRQWRAQVAGIGESVRTPVLGATAPDSVHEWHALRRQIRSAETSPAGSVFTRSPRRLLWSVSALAAVLLAGVFFGTRGLVPKGQTVDVAQAARAEFVEGAEGSASPLVYVDQDSGWLVIWTADNGTQAGS